MGRSPEIDLRQALEACAVELLGAHRAPFAPSGDLWVALVVVITLMVGRCIVSTSHYKSLELDGPVCRAGQGVRAVIGELFGLRPFLVPGQVA